MVATWLGEISPSSYHVDEFDLAVPVRMRIASSLDCQRIPTGA